MRSLPWTQESCANPLDSTLFPGAGERTLESWRLAPLLEPTRPYSPSESWERAQVSRIPASCSSHLVLGVCWQGRGSGMTPALVSSPSIKSSWNIAVVKFLLEKLRQELVTSQHNYTDKELKGEAPLWWAAA